MKLLLFKALLFKRTREQGFTLPMVIGIGLIMVLLGSISLVQSSEESLNSIATTQASTSLAIAELGVARYRQLIDNNRILAIHNRDNWVNIANEACDVITDDPNDVISNGPGWANNDVNIWRPIELDETAAVPPFDFNNDGDTTDANAGIGSYRLVDYVYVNDTNAGVDNGVFDQTDDTANQVVPGNPETGPRGILTVQGQAPGSNSVAQIQVTIPIGVNIDDLEALDPGIWIRQANVANLGTIDFTTNNPIPPKNLVLHKDNVVDSECDTFDTAVIPGPNNIIHVNNTGIRDPRNLPPLAVLPANGNFNPLDGNIDNNGLNAQNELILGLNSHTPNEETEVLDFYYDVAGDLIIDDGESLIADGLAKVVVIVPGNLIINGRANLFNSSVDATSSRLEIHVGGNVNIASADIIEINGLIHAPNGTVDINGGPIINLRGAIWANNWDNGGGIINVIREDADDESYKHYSTVPQRTPRPLTYPPTGWEQQQVAN